jgi:integrase
MDTVAAVEVGILKDPARIGEVTMFQHQKEVDYTTRVESELMAWSKWASESRKPHFERSTILDTVRHLRYISQRCDIFSRESFREWAGTERLEGRLTKNLENEYTKYVNRWGLFRRAIGEPWDRFEYVPKSKKSHKISIYTEKEVKQMFKFSRGETVEELRNHTMLFFAVNTGLRASEIANLKVENVHNSYIEVFRGKGEKDRDVPIKPHIYRKLMEYFPRRNIPDCPYFFTTRKGRITSAYIERIAGDLRRKMGRGLKWQKCRHTFATRLIDEGVNIVAISKILGHEDVQTTIDFYVDYNQNKAFTDYRKTNPKMFMED